jgi:hypothetical protein
MATLRPAHPAPDEPLTSEHTVGRSASCRLRLAGAEVSALHAVVRWTGQAWEVRDLGSRNGVRLSGERLAPGSSRVLQVGDELGFGGATGSWTVTDVSAPEPLARGADGTWQRGEGGLLLLPRADQVEVCVYEEAGGWVAVAGEQLRAVTDGEELRAGGATWTVFLPDLIVETREDDPVVIELASAALELAVSQDEENVELTLRAGDRVLCLPHRAHLYLVLSLARARLRDVDAPESERGWVYQDEVMRDHRIPIDQFNVVLFRARRQLKQAGVAGADGLIERRRGSGQLRLGPANVSVRAL